MQFSLHTQGISFTQFNTFSRLFHLHRFPFLLTIQVITLHLHLSKSISLTHTKISFTTNHFSQWVIGNGQSSPLNLRTPANLTAEENSGNIILNWDSVAGATSYKIYSSDLPDSGFIQIGNSGTNSFTVTNVGENRMKYFYIIAQK